MKDRARWVWILLAGVAVAVGVGLRPFRDAPSRPAALPPAREGSQLERKEAPPIRVVTGLAEALVPTHPTTPEEDRALTAAIEAFRASTGPVNDAAERYAPLARFVEAHPNSGWAPALHTNLGLAYFSAGYFSRAFASWQSAWKHGKSATEPRAKALVDRAVGELARMHARIGHAEEIQALLAEIGDRPVTGSATEMITGAREGAWMMQNDWGMAYLCGPRALKNVLLARNARPEELAFLEEERSGPNGFSLAQVAALADRAKLRYRLIHREPGEAIPVPAIVHWKVRHYAAITGHEEGGLYHIEDPTFGGADRDLTVSRAAIDAEGSGYFLVPADQPQDLGWRSVPEFEARTIYGMGTTSSSWEGAFQALDQTLNPSGCAFGMCAANAHTMLVSLHLNDTPVGYEPQKGPPVFVRLTYNQRDSAQPANPTFFGVSPKWTLSVLSYVQDDPASAGIGVTRYVAGGGNVTYAGYDAVSGEFKPEKQGQAVLVRVPPTGDLWRYELRLPDGSQQVFSHVDGATTSPRRVFLTEILDPTGNALKLNYDPDVEEGQVRLASVTDAMGCDTTFSYTKANPLLVESITDPFGRSAELEYDANGRLSVIRDVIGIESKFGYDANGLVNTLTTPYGTSRFAYGDLGGNGRWLELTDALGFTERLEFNQSTNGAASVEASQVPAGINIINGYYVYRNTFHWDKNTYPKYGKESGRDYTKATITHWLHVAGASVTSPVMESFQRPLENRVFFNYAGQSAAYYDAAMDQPSAVGRLLDDGKTELTLATYNPFGKPLSVTDPLGRVTEFEYAANGIELLSVRQRAAAATPPVTVARFTYSEDGRHLLKTATDAAGNVTSYGYTITGQLASVTDPKKIRTTYQYDTEGRLVAVKDHREKTLLALTYDDYDRVATRTDGAGYSVRYEYDDFDRPIKATYPDGTFEEYAYNKLDLVSVRGRTGKRVKFAYDANRRLVSVTDPLGQVTKYEYYPSGALKSLTDANGHTTTWELDLQGRPVAKQYENGSSERIVYESATSRIQRVTDANGQHTDYTYNVDGSVASVAYPNAKNATPTVTFQYDALLPRLLGMRDGTGETSYGYHPISEEPRLGAGLLQFVTSPVAGSSIASDTLRLSYDALNRVSVQNLDGVTEETLFDELGRVIGVNNALDEFSYEYLDPTARVRAITAKIGPNAAFDYLDAKGDHLLGKAAYSSSGGSLLSEFGYAYDADHNVTTFSERTGAVAAESADGVSVPNGVKTGPGAPLPPSPRRPSPFLGAPFLLSVFLAGLAALLLAVKRGKRLGSTVLVPAAVLLAITSCGDDDPGSRPTPNADAGASGGGAPGDGGAAGHGGAPVEDAGSGGALVSGTPEIHRETTYGYDDVNRLTSALVSTDGNAPAGPQYEYSYDAVSNLTKISANGDTRKLEYTDTNAVSGVAYDGNGSPLDFDGKQYTWDGANRLIRITSGDRESRFTYDGLSRLVRIVDLKDDRVIADRAFTWCGAERCLERDNLKTGSPIIKQYFPQGVLIQGRPYYYVTDTLGSIRQLIDANGTVVAQYDYDPYGNRTKLSGEIDADFGYAGYFHHEASGLDFALYRAYDPSLGRWLNRDPIGEQGGLNLYGYVRGNPVVRFDPTGLFDIAESYQRTRDKTKEYWQRTRDFVEPSVEKVKTWYRSNKDELGRALLDAALERIGWAGDALQGIFATAEESQAKCIECLKAAIKSKGLENRASYCDADPDQIGCLYGVLSVTDNPHEAEMCRNRELIAGLLARLAPNVLQQSLP